MLCDLVFSKIMQFIGVLPLFAQNSDSYRFCSIAKITFDDLFNGLVDETIILLVQAVRIDLVDICINANMFANVQKLSTPHEACYDGNPDLSEGFIPLGQVAY
jgi:hypothetical protein